MLFEPYYVPYVSSGNRVAAYWEKAANSAYDMFSKYKYLIVNGAFSSSLSSCTFSRNVCVYS